MLGRVLRMVDKVDSFNFRMCGIIMSMLLIMGDKFDSFIFRMLGSTSMMCETERTRLEVYKLFCHTSNYHQLKSLNQAIL